MRKQIIRGIFRYLKDESIPNTIFCLILAGSIYITAMVLNVVMYNKILFEREDFLLLTMGAIIIFIVSFVGLVVFPALSKIRRK